MTLNQKTEKKIFVLDTSVILYNHNAINSFKEHDVAIPALVLEELDNFKNGNETRNFEARNFIRLIDNLLGDKLLNNWVEINVITKARFKVLLNEQPLQYNAEKLYSEGKSDNRILNAVLALKEEMKDCKVILVSKDICLRLKALALGIDAEDYEAGKVKNFDKLYSGKTILSNIDEELFNKLTVEKIVEVSKFKLSLNNHNHFYVLENNEQRQLVFYHAHNQVFNLVDEEQVFNICPRNVEQSFALNALLNPAIKLVTIQGNAGTGKTLLALASALAQRRNFRQIFVARPIVPLSNKDLGYLPGDIKSKVNPYMLPIWDNLKFIKEQFVGDEKMQSKIDELIETNKIEIAPLAYIRGRTLDKIFFIVDEAQNLTPHEIKTIISRAGADTKIVFTGDIYQIDAPYLDAESNGLSYLIDKAKNHPIFAHITLQQGERSELANLANTNL